LTEVSLDRTGVALSESSAKIARWMFIRSCYRSVLCETVSWFARNNHYVGDTMGGYKRRDMLVAY